MHLTFIRITAATIYIVLSVGCTVLGPDFQTPDAPIADTWSATDNENFQESDEDIAQWWKNFRDPVLDELIAAATLENLDLQIAAIRIFQARAQLGIAVGGLYPQVQRASGGINRIELSENSPNASPLLDSVYRDLDLGFDAAWEIDLWGRFRRSVQAADASLLAEFAGYANALVSLSAEVANAYIAMRTFETRLKIAQENVTIQSRSLKIATVRFENGATTALDVEQAKTLLSNTQALIPELEIGERQARNALSILLGKPPGQFGDVEIGEGDIPEVPAEIAVGIPADLVRRRPDIRQAEMQAAAQSALIGVAQADLYPQFSIAGQVGFRTSDTGASELSDLLDGDSLQAGLGPSFQWNILNYGRIKNAVRVEDARFQQAIVTYRNIVLRAANEVENALIAFLRGKQRVKYLLESVEAARRSVDLALIQYRDGTVDYTRVLDTQTFLSTQQDSYTAARGQVLRDLIAMYKSLGGGWQPNSSNVKLPASVVNEMQDRSDWGELLEQEPIKQPFDRQIRKPDW